ncbi:helicase-exonuclease AddAB subunit AddA [Microbacteriaceae bacterium 4G12]
MIGIEKPVDSQWTDDQWKAIVASGSDILVAAAAGSGKTAVLVERMIKKITSEEGPVDVDRLLVVTFTNASAQEMKNRIGEALEKELAKNPSSYHLRKQLSLLNRASISTLHSFCLQVIRTYYYMLDIDPRFRIANETEIELLKEEVLDEILEEEYGLENNEAFFDLVDRYTNDRSDNDLQDMILALHRESMAHPNPNEWLDRLVSVYDVADKTIDEVPYTKYILEDVLLRFEATRQYLNRGFELAMRPDGPAPRVEALEADMVQLERLFAAARTSWSALHEAMQGVEWVTLKRIRKGEYNEELLKKTDTLRNKAKDEIKKLKEELFGRAPDSYLQDLRDLHPVLQRLTRIVKEFSRRFQQMKREKSMVDFTDLEHFCLEILTDHGGPSAVALQYREKFVEVLVDEYQDTNFVQESILQLVTKETESAGNLFMVGDVKQSIYRFRLAEPGLFLGKYKRFTSLGIDGGLRIDLAKNFRSRHEVLAGTNFIFKQIMGETVGEIEYDHDAELKLGASYPEGKDTAAEWLLVHQPKAEDRMEDGDEVETELIDLETAQLEARLIGRKIQEMVEEGYEVYDRKHNTTRPVSYRDFVILLRSMPWAPQIMEELKQQGIPVYAELSTGYFEATEVSVMLNVLRVIDNPSQDIPLASVLRSPIVGLTDEELAMLRIHAKKGSFYQAMRSFFQIASVEDELQNKLSSFAEHLKEWRSFARQQPLSDLIWKVYRETGYYDFVGGLPSGKQRQANLRVLYDRARQYEATSFRGLFRFLRFIERILERGDDMGTARALGEQEDVVRLMTIHKSKGLEFPIVFVAGLSRRFNIQDLNKRFLLHKDLGFGSPFIDPQKRMKYTTLSQLAIKRKVKMELIAEEMRVLYVALTRAKEKLILLGTVKDLDKALERWQEVQEHPEWLLPDYVRAQASCYMDWIAPALLRHKDIPSLSGELANIPNDIYEYPAKWKVEVIEAASLTATEQPKGEKWELIEALRQQQTVTIESEEKQEVYERLTWQYGFQDAPAHRAKQSVTEIKRNYQAQEESGNTFLKPFRASIEKRPKFMERKGLTATERGTAFHAVMQHVDLRSPITVDSIKNQLAKMVNDELLTLDQADSIEPEGIVAFFHTSLGKRIVLQAEQVEREVPFTMMISAKDAYYDWQDEQDENVLVQGVIDCMIEEEDGIILLDFKTDAITNRFSSFEEAKPILENRYRLQLKMYSQALEKSLRKPVKEKYLYFFDGSHILQMDE